MLQTDTSVIKLDINQIIPNKYQPRKVFDDNDLNSLAESIKTYGIINPILVRKKEDKYEIIAGERRFRAAKKVGLTEVPVIIKDANEQQMAELALIENIQRQGLSPIEEAKSYEKIMRIGNQTQISLATKLGKSQSSIANKIRLLSLPEEIQDALANKKISERHARSLITVEDKEKQLEKQEKIIKEKLTVKETEQIINEKEITETEIKQAISDIMKSLNIEEDSTEESLKEENKKEEKEDDNMNNGNFFPNFDNNNQVNNNASLNMMNMQSMAPMAPEPEMVMPTMTPTMPQMTEPFAPAMSSFEQFNQPAPQPELTVPNNGFNPMDSFMPAQNNPMQQPMPTIEPPLVNDTLSFVQPEPQMPEPVAATMPMMDTPLFNPNAVMPNQTPELVVPEPQPMAPMGFDIPVTTPEPMMDPQVDRLTELQNLLSSNGYNYKVFNNETDSCVIIELPRN